MLTFSCFFMCIYVLWMPEELHHRAETSPSGWTKVTAAGVRWFLTPESCELCLKTPFLMGQTGRVLTVCITLKGTASRCDLTQQQRQMMIKKAPINHFTKSLCGSNDKNTATTFLSSFKHPAALAANIKWWLSSNVWGSSDWGRLTHTLIHTHIHTTTQIKHGRRTYLHVTLLQT